MPSIQPIERALELGQATIRAVADACEEALANPDLSRSPEFEAFLGGLVSRLESVAEEFGIEIGMSAQDIAGKLAG